jgi:L-ascorbate metabolism protein UlaG (beta-lactamase superfamily)
MKKIVSLLGIILLVVFLFGLVVFGLLKNKAIKNKIFYSIGLVPKELFTLSEKINSIPPEPLTQPRLKLLAEIDDFIKTTGTGKYFSPRAYGLIKIRLDPLTEEIAKTKVPKGQVKLWYLYNMGVIAKSDSAVIGFDLPSSVVYSDTGDFTKDLDVLIYTHLHGDHFDPQVVKTALKNGVSVVVPDDKVSLYQNENIKIVIRNENGEDMLDFLGNRYGLKSENLIAVKPEEKITVKGVDITGYPGIHMYNPDPQTNSGMDLRLTLSPIDWFYVELDGITFLHTGDSSQLLSKTDFLGKNIDVFIAHIDDMRTSDNLAKLVNSAKIILPLHVLELQHGSEILDYMMYRNILDANTDGYWRGSNKTKFIPLIWGESIFSEGK